MKNIFSLLLLAFVFVSCENDVKTNTPAFQGEKDNLFWRAGDSRVTVNSNGTITLNGYTDYEVISVTVPNAVGTYDLGTANNSNFASYSYNNEGTVLYYETSYQEGPANKIYRVNGGSGYASLDGSIVQTIGGNGNGLNLKLTVASNGVVSDAKITARGIGYLPGDIVTAVGGNNNATFRVVNTTLSNGEVEIEKIENGTYTGNIKFNASDDNGNIVNFNNGKFYKVPVY